MILGLDLGYSAAKLVSTNPDGLPRMATHPAGACPISQLPTGLGGEAHLGGAVRVEIDGEPYAALAEPRDIHDHARPLHEDYPSSKEYRSLFLGSLYKVGARRIDWLVTGLPVAQAKDPVRRQHLERQLAGEHVIRDQIAVTVDKVTVLAQPVGAWVSWLADNPEFTAMDVRALIIDPGFYSVDWCLIERGKIKSDASGSSTQATSAVIEQAAKVVFDRHGARISISRLEEALRNGKSSISAGGQTVMMGPLMAESAARLSGSVVNQIKQSLRSQVDDVDIVLLAGGGSNLYAGAVREAMPKARVEVVSDAVLANARGFYYFGAAKRP